MYNGTCIFNYPSIKATTNIEKKKLSIRNGKLYSEPKNIIQQNENYIKLSIKETVIIEKRNLSIRNVSPNTEPKK